MSKQSPPGEEERFEAVLQVLKRAEPMQAKKLWELLPRGPNEPWQMDVTNVYIPGYGHVTP